MKIDPIFLLSKLEKKDSSIFNLFHGRVVVMILLSPNDTLNCFCQEIRVLAGEVQIRKKYLSENNIERVSNTCASLALARACKLRT